METRITATELAKSLSDILNRVRYRREGFIIERNGEPVATLSPTGPAVGMTFRQLPGRLRDMPMPGDGFADDLEAIQSAQPPAIMPTWHS